MRPLNPSPSFFSIVPAVNSQPSAGKARSGSWAELLSSLLLYRFRNWKLHGHLGLGPQVRRFIRRYYHGCPRKNYRRPTSTPNQTAPTQTPPSSSWTFLRRILFTSPMKTLGTISRLASSRSKPESYGSEVKRVSGRSTLVQENNPATGWTDGGSPWGVPDRVLARPAAGRSSLEDRRISLSDRDSRSCQHFESENFVPSKTQTPS